METAEFKKRLQKLDELFQVQCDDGNWNYSSYMHGMTNGLALAISIMTDEEPAFLDAPELFIQDAELLDRFNRLSVYLKVNGR